MSKVLFVIDTLKMGGAEKITLLIASRMMRLDAVLCTVYNGDDLSQASEYKELRIIKLGSNAKYGFLYNSRKLREVIEAEQPDLVVSTLFKSNMVTRLALLRSSIPLLGTFVNEEYNASRFTTGSFKERVYYAWQYFFDLISVHCNSHIVSNSESIKREDGRKLLYPQNKISVIYRGREIPRHQLRNMPEQRSLSFLSVGRLIKRKGQLEIVLAFAQLIQDYPNASLQIAGEGPYRHVLEDAIERLGIGNSVHLLGHVSNVDELLKKATFFVFASHYEGFSGALVEAMLAGKIIICSDIPMNLEAVTNGDTGLVFRCGDVADLADKLHFAAENRESLEYLGFNAVRLAQERFDIEKALVKYEDLYEAVIREHRNR